MPAMCAKVSRCPSWAAPFRYINCPHVETIDHDHVGRVLAERYRVGPGYLHDVRARVKAAREAMERNG